MRLTHSLILPAALAAALLGGPAQAQDAAPAPGRPPAGRPPAANAAPGAASPAQSPAERARAAIDQMLSALAVAPTEALSAALEERIQSAWIAQATPAVALLLNKGLRNLQNGAAADAADDLAAVTDLQPDYIAGWSARARAEFDSGSMEGAVRALEQAIAKEPRHYPSFKLLSRIAEAREDWKGAYDAWKKVLEIAPRTSGGADRLKDLQRRAFGDET